MPMRDLPPDLAKLSLDEVSAAFAARKLPPVDSWHPPDHGHSEMRIAADGRWFHQGGEIKRPAMVQLFSTILRREGDGGYVLVTPAEKLTIDVEDAPFVAVELKSEGESSARKLGFRLNTDELLVAGPEHAIRVIGQSDDVRPYLHVRRGLEARIGRSLWYEIAEFAIAEGFDPPAIWSDGVRFPLVAE
jgi:uncharacterized protein